MDTLLNSTGLSLLSPILGPMLGLTAGAVLLLARDAMWPAEATLRARRD